MSALHGVLNVTYWLYPYPRGYLWDVPVSVTLRLQDGHNPCKKAETLTKDIAIDVKAIGKDPCELLQKARELRDKAERKNQPYDEIWLVFDRDKVPLSTLQQVLKEAQAEGFNVAFSNPKFELWLLLHDQAC
jgi:hypothetical protein